MTDNSNKRIDWEKLDETRLELAVQEIVKSENLRFLFRYVFGMLGVTGTPDGPGPHELARAVGRHGAGTELLELLEARQVGLFATLLLEDAQEQQQRVEGAYT